MALLESRVDQLWMAKQSGKGTAATVADKVGRKVGGDIDTNVNHASENYSDGSRFGDTLDWVDTILGEGGPVFQAQPGVVGHLAAVLLGSETVTAVTGTTTNYDHVATPGATGYWSTLWKKVGATVGPLRQQHIDARLVSLRIEGSSANKVVKITPTYSILDAGVIFTVDPVRVYDTDLPHLYTEGAGRFNIDGTVYSGHSAFAIVISDGITPWYGDDVKPFDVGFGIATVALEGITLALDTAGLARYYTQIYGMANPPVGQRPAKTVLANGSYTVDLRKGSNQTVATTGTPTGGSFTLTVPGWGTTAAIAYNATAAAVQTALAAVVGTGKVTVTGGPLPTAVTVVFTDTQSVMTKVDSLTGGSSPASVITDNGYQRGLKIEVPGVHWHPDMSIPGNPDGGPTEIAIAADARPIAGQPIVRITTRSGDSAAY